MTLEAGQEDSSADSSWNIHRIAPSHLTEEVKKGIERYIVVNELGPGDKLPTESELCDLFKVSRTAIREAMKVLAVLGIVSIEAGRGTFVRQFDIKSVLGALPASLIFRDRDFYEIIEIRRHLETFCVERATAIALENRDHAGLQKMRDCVEAMERKNTPKAHDVLVEEDVEFHRTLATMADNRVLLMILEIFWKLREGLPGDNSPQALRALAQRHRRLYEAIASGDKDAALNQLHVHYGHTYSEVGDVKDAAK